MPPRQGFASRLADAMGEVLESRPQGTWVIVREIASRDYAENMGGPSDGVEPVIVRLILSTPPEGEKLKAQADQLASAIGKVCGRPKVNVHVIYEPPGAGRIAFGGNLID